MEDDLWSMTQVSRVLQDLRADIRSVWEDDTSRDLTRRYFDPHHDGDRRMLEGLNDQKAAIDESSVSLDSADRLARDAAEHAERVMESLRECNQELKSSNFNLDRFTELDSEARSKFPLIQGLIDQANRACSA